MTAIINRSVLYTTNSLYFNASIFEKLYRVTILIAESSTNKTVINYNVHVNSIRVFDNGSYLCSIQTHGFLVNGEEPDLMLEQLAWKCRSVLQHCIYHIDRTGIIISLENHHSIIKSWEQLKQRLEMEYSGAIFKKYIDLYEKVIYDAAILLSKLKKDIFIGQFYSAMYGVPFQDYLRKAREQVQFFGIDYEIDMLYALQQEGIRDGDGLLHLVKTIDKKAYNYADMPIEDYKTAYVLNGDFSINSINGQFENHNKKYGFSITEVITE